MLLGIERWNLQGGLCYIPNIWEKWNGTVAVASALPSSVVVQSVSTQPLWLHVEVIYSISLILNPLLRSAAPHLQCLLQCLQSSSHRSVSLLGLQHHLYYYTFFVFLHKNDKNVEDTYDLRYGRMSFRFQWLNGISSSQQHYMSNMLPIWPSELKLDYFKDLISYKNKNYKNTIPFHTL